MMMRLVSTVAVVSLALAGCGGSICDDLDDSGKNLVDKVKACPAFSDVTYTEPTEAEKQQCEDSLKACTDADKDALNKFIDCVNDLPTCTAATEQQFSTSFLGCATPLQNVTDACLATSSNGTVRKGAALVKGH